MESIAGSPGDRLCPGWEGRGLWQKLLGLELSSPKWGEFALMPN